MPSRYVPTQPTVTPPTEAKPTTLSLLDKARLVAATGLRIAGPWAGTVAGGALGAAAGLPEGGVGAIPLGAAGAALGGSVGGGASEALAELIEPHNPEHKINKGRVAVSAALGAVPGSAVVRSGKPLVSAALGAGLGYAGVAGNKIAEGEGALHAANPLNWDKGELAFGPVLGGALGAGFSKISHPGVTPKAAPEVFEIEPTIRPGGSTLSGTVKTGAKGKTTLTNAKNVSASNVNRTGTITSSGDMPPVPTPREMPNLVKPGAITPDEYAADLARFNTTPELTKTPIVGTPAEASGRVQKIVAGNTKAATKTALDVEKAQEAANKLVGKEKADAAKAQTKFVESEAAQAAKNLNAKGAFTRKVEVAAANADTEAGRRAAAAQKLADNEQNLLAIEAAKAGREATPPRISESVSAKTGEGQRSSMSRSFVEPKPPDTGDIEGGASLLDDLAVQPKSVAKQTLFSNKDTARDAAIATGAKDVIKIGRGKYRLVYDETVRTPVNEPVAPGPAAQKFNSKVKDTLQKTTGMLPDEEPVLPTAPPAEKAVANEMAPSLERDVIAGKRYTNKSEATAIAKATGGTIHQDGPRRYSVRFTPEEVPVAEPITPSPTIELPKPKDMPRANVAPTEPSLPPLETGDLTPDEFRRYMDIRPSRGISRTPAEVAEYKALQQRINARPPAVEVSDYTGGQPQHTIEAPVPGTPEQTMEDMAAVANKPGPPVAKVNFPTSKLPGKSQIPDEVQSSLLDAAVPEVPQGGAIPARMFKSKAAATAENYGAVKAAKAAGETVPEEGRAIAGKTAAAERKAAALDATSDDLTKMTPEDQSKALSDLVKKFKSSKGEINMVALSRLGLGAAGAAAGAAATPDDPLTGALLGGAAGAFAPSVVRALIGHASSGNVPESSIKDIAAKAEDTVKTFFRMMPDYQRFSLLSSPVNLAMNMWVGPWGSAIMAGLEHAIQLDPKGMDALKLLLNPKNFPKEFWNVRKEAGSLIHNAEERTEGVMGLAGPKWFRDATSFPGVGMTAGDVAARNLLMKAGFSADEARTITLTSEPYSAFGRMVSSAKKGAQTEGGKKSWFVNMALPFYRTNVNQIEQSLDRTPFIGILWNKYAKDIPEDTGIQIAKQLMGGGVTAASYLLGTVVPPDDNRYVVKFINNFGGQYGKLASVAFVMGQAKAQGKEPIGALQQSVTQDMPLPSMDIINNVLADIRALKSGQTDKLKMPFKVLPGMFDPKVPGSVPQLIGGGLAIAGLTGATPTDTARPTQSPSQPSVTRSRYIPTSPKR